MKCKTCKYWDTEKTCGCPKMRTGYGTDLADLKPDEVLIEDDEGWAWVVGPEFGCIHHDQLQICAEGD